MKRAECIGMLYPELDDKVVVTIMGACAQELYDLGHKDNFFYLQHAMGLASSIGLGLALHLPHEKIVVLDGDGSVLMNLGTLATLARYRPRESRPLHLRQRQPALDRRLRLAHHVGHHRSRRDRARRRHRARRRGRFGDGLRRGGDRGVRAKRSQRHRRQGRSRRPESLRHGSAAAGKRLSLQTMDRGQEVVASNRDARGATSTRSPDVGYRAASDASSGPMSAHPDATGRRVESRHAQGRRLDAAARTVDTGHRPAADVCAPRPA